MYDVAILGGGPAGVTAAVYSARYRLKTAVFCEVFGGQVTKTHKIENYPGFSSISGTDLSDHFKKQLEYNKVEIIEKLIDSVKKVDDYFLINGEYKARSVILAMGMKHRKLGVAGEEEFAGRGVSYCATCDAAFFKEKIVGVVGGNDSAAVAADILAQHAKKVYIIYRKDKIRAEPAWVESLEKNDKIEIITNSNVLEIKGTQMVESLVLDTGKILEVNGVFIEIGSLPNKALVSELGIKNDNGFIEVGPDQATNLEGIYSAGDISLGSNGMRQIVSAAAEGAIAAQSIFIWLKKKNLTEY